MNSNESLVHQMRDIYSLNRAARDPNRVRRVACLIAPHELQGGTLERYEYIEAKLKRYSMPAAIDRVTGVLSVESGKLTVRVDHETSIYTWES